MLTFAMVSAEMEIFFRKLMVFMISEVQIIKLISVILTADESGRSIVSDNLSGSHTMSATNSVNFVRKYAYSGNKKLMKVM